MTSMPHIIMFYMQWRGAPTPWGTGSTCLPLLQMDTVSRNNKQEADQNYTDHHESAHQND